MAAVVAGAAGVERLFVGQAIAVVVLAVAGALGSTGGRWPRRAAGPSSVGRRSRYRRRRRPPPIAPAAGVGADRPPLVDLSVAVVIGAVAHLGPAASPRRPTRLRHAPYCPRRTGPPVPSGGPHCRVSSRSSPRTVNQAVAVVIRPIAADFAGIRRTRRRRCFAPSSVAVHIRRGIADPAGPGDPFAVVTVPRRESHPHRYQAALLINRRKSLSR
jgi:hypothetical protein